MCTNFIPADSAQISEIRLNVLTLPSLAWPHETYPGYLAPILVRAKDKNSAECLVAHFGLTPRWARDASHATTLSRGTYNARSETVAEKPSFCSPWRERRWALAPMQAFFEPCWEQGSRAVRWRIARADEKPFAVAGLWERWTNPQDGEVTTSFTLLTVNADGHALMGRMHRSDDEKRMPVIVPASRYGDWLHADLGQATAMMVQTPAEELVGRPDPKSGGAIPAAEAPQNLSLF